MTGDQVFEEVRECLTQVLGVSGHPVTLDTTLEDLAVESLSTLEIIFCIESKFDINVAPGELRDRLFGDLKEDEFFGEDRVVTEAGRGQLKRALPGHALATLEGTITEETLFSLLTVRQIVEVTEEKIAKRASEVK